jgi:ech hydrogenase subunit D
MSEAKHLIQDNTTIKASELLDVMQDLKSEGYRLSQACAANTKDGMEVWYSMDKGDYILKNFIMKVPEAMTLQSITAIYWYAFIYENEMNDLFGIKFKNSALDFGGHFFKLSEETPWKPKK